MPKVSILIPAFKAERFLPQTLQSVEEQTFIDWEVIVFEDGCYDHTAEIVETFAKAVEQRVQLIRNQENQGVASARNQLIEAANGSILAWIDADDLWEPNHLSDALKLMEQEHTDWFVGGIQRIDGEGNKTHPPELPIPSSIQELPRALLDKNFILTSATLMKRDAFGQDLRFNLNYQVGEDLDLFIRLAQAGKKPAYSDQATVLYRNYPESATGSAIRFNLEYSKVFENYLNDPQIGPACRRGVILMLHNGIRLCWRSNPLLARQAYLRLVRVGPAKPSARLRMLLSPLAGAFSNFLKTST